MSRKTIVTDKVTTPAWLPLSPAVKVKANEFVFVSGRIGRRGDGTISENISEQTEVALNDIKTILEEAGTSLENVVKVNIFLVDRKHFNAMNKVYEKFFPNNRPARRTIEARLMAEDALIEIDAVAIVVPK